MRTPRVWIAAVLGLAVAVASSPAARADGNVSVASSGGVLRIVGDAADNSVVVTSGGTEGAFTVTGTGGTTVNSGASATVTGVRGVSADMGDGADRLELTGMRIRTDVRVKLGGGPDVLVMSKLRVRGIVVVRCGLGDDRVSAEDDSIFARDFTVLGSDGNDVVDFLDSQCKGRLRVDSGNNSDTIRLENSHFFGNVSVEARGGDDDLELDDSDFDRHVDADMGGGEDSVTIRGSDFDDTVELDGGGGPRDEFDLRSDNHFRERPYAWDFER
ncbi:MAG: hypothetical protein K8T90_09335 [Planctomycetes bacterium]|nr:hypothetical protein [Planctomycetota bacterium]